MTVSYPKSSQMDNPSNNQDGINLFEQSENQSSGISAPSKAAGQVPTYIDFAMTGDPAIDDILSGHKWNSNELTFGFPLSSSVYGANTGQLYAPEVGVSVANTAQIHETFRDVMSLNMLTNLRITDSNDYNGAISSINVSNSTSAGTSYAILPYSNTGGSLFLGTDGINPTGSNYDSGAIFLRKIGLLVGLYYPRNFNGQYHSNSEYSVENYYGSGAAFNSIFGNQINYAQSFMQDDIAALQAMYGANRYYAGVSQTFSWSKYFGDHLINGQIATNYMSGTSTIFQTVWTQGAVATYDLRNFGDDAIIDLSPGGAVKFSNAQLACIDPSLPNKYAQGNVYNALLYNGDISSEVSGLLTGEGNEVVHANDLYDTISLGGGNSSVYAGHGGALISVRSGAVVPGRGVDTLVEAGARSQYTVGLLNGTVKVTDNITTRSGVQSLNGFRFIQFSDQLLDAQTLSSAPPILAHQTDDIRTVIGSSFSFVMPQSTFTDQNGGAVTYTVAQADGTALPSWAVFDQVSGTFSGTTPNTAGALSIRVNATTSDGRKSFEAFKIYNTPSRPQLNHQTEDLRISGGNTFSTVVPGNAFTNPATGSLLYTVTQADGTPLPSWAAFDASTLTISGTSPTSATTLSLRINATTSDGGTSAEGFKVLVSNPKPVLAQQAPDIRTTAGQTIAFDLPVNSFTDPAGGNVTYTAAQTNGSGALPTWLTFDNATGHFAGTAPNATSNVGIEVDATSLAGVVSAEAFHLYIQPTNPTFMLQAHDQRVAVGGVVSYGIPANSFTDSAGGPVSYVAMQVGGAPLPTWLTFDPVANHFDGTAPTLSGNLGILIQAATQSGGSAAEAFHMYYR